MHEPEAKKMKTNDEERQEDGEDEGKDKQGQMRTGALGPAGSGPSGTLSPAADGAKTGGDAAVQSPDDTVAAAKPGGDAGAQSSAVQETSADAKPREESEDAAAKLPEAKVPSQSNDDPEKVAAAAGTENLTDAGTPDKQGGSSARAPQDTEMSEKKRKAGTAAENPAPLKARPKRNA